MSTKTQPASSSKPSVSKEGVIESIYHNLYYGEKILEELLPTLEQSGPNPSLSKPPKALPPSSGVNVLEADRLYLHTRAPTTVIRNDSSVSLLASAPPSASSSRNPSPVQPPVSQYEPNFDALSTSKPVQVTSLYNSDRFTYQKKVSDSSSGCHDHAPRPGQKTELQIELLATHEASTGGRTVYEYRIRETTEQILYELETPIPKKSYSFSKAKRFKEEKPEPKLPPPSRPLPPYSSGARGGKVDSWAFLSDSEAEEEDLISLRKKKKLEKAQSPVASPNLPLKRPATPPESLPPVETIPEEDEDEYMDDYEASDAEPETSSQPVEPASTDEPLSETPLPSAPPVAPEELQVPEPPEDSGEKSDPFILSPEDLTGRPAPSTSSLPPPPAQKFDPSAIVVSDDDDSSAPSTTLPSAQKTKPSSERFNLDTLAYRPRTDIGVMRMIPPKEKRPDKAAEDRKRLEYLLDDLMGPGAGDIFPTTQRPEEERAARRGPGAYNPYPSAFGEVKGGKFSKSQKETTEVTKSVKPEKAEEKKVKSVFELIDEALKDENSDKKKKKTPLVALRPPPPPNAQKSVPQTQKMPAKTQKTPVKTEKSSSRSTSSVSKDKSKRVSPPKETPASPRASPPHLTLMEKFKLEKKKNSEKNSLKTFLESERKKKILEINEKREKFLQKMKEKNEKDAKLEKKKLELISPHPLSYSVQYGQVEPAPRASVSMAASAKARQASEAALNNNPRVRSVLERKKREAEEARAKIYGPQLHAPWVADKPSIDPSRAREAAELLRLKKLARDLKKKNDTKEKHWYDFIHDDEDGEGEGEGEGEDTAQDPKSDLDAPGGLSFLQASDGEDSELEDVLELLVSRQQARIPQGQKEDPSPYTDAYLRSSHTGTIYNKKIEYFAPPESTEKIQARQRKLKLEEDYRASIDPALLAYEPGDPDYPRLEKKSIDFSKGIGRSRLRINKKGEAEVLDFLDPRVFEDDLVGPGEYDLDHYYEAQDKKIPVVDFEKQLSRKERAQAAGEGATDILRRPGEGMEIEDILEAELGIGGRLDLDPVAVKDKMRKDRKSDIVLYRKDRFEEPKKRKLFDKDGNEIVEEEEDPSLLTQEDWFQQKVRREREQQLRMIPDWSKQVSRGQDGEDKRLEDELYARELIEELGMDTAIAGITGHNLDLDKKDPKEKVPLHGEFLDAETHPRFSSEEERQEIANQKFRANQEKIKYLKSRKWQEYLKNNEAPLPENLEKDFWTAHRERNPDLPHEENPWDLGKGYLDMGKMVGRETNDDSFIQEEVYGAIDPNLAKEYAQETDAHRRGGQDQILRKEVRAAGAINFDKQLSRKDVQRKEKDLNQEEQLEEDLLIGQLAGIAGNLVELKAPKEDNYWKDGLKNAVRMDQDLPREKDDVDLSDEYVSFQKVALYLSPKDNKRKRVKGVLKWDKVSTGQTGASDLHKVLDADLVPPEDGRVLDLDKDIDLNKFRKNYKEGIVPSMDKQQGRGGREKDKAVFDANLEKELGLGTRPELDLVVDRKPIEKKAKGGAVAYQSVLKNRKLDGTSWASSILNDHEGDELIIVPIDNKDPLLDPSSNKKGAVSTFKSTSGRTNMRSEQAVEALVRAGDINPYSTQRYEGQVLELESETGRGKVSLPKARDSTTGKGESTGDGPIKEGAGIKNIVTFRNTVKKLPTKAEAKAVSDYDEELAKLNYFDHHQSKASKRSAKSVSPSGRRKAQATTKSPTRYDHEALGTLSPVDLEGFDDVDGIAPSKDYGGKYEGFEAKLAKLSLED